MATEWVTGAIWYENLQKHLVVSGCSLHEFEMCCGFVFSLKNLLYQFKKMERWPPEEGLIRIRLNYVVSNMNFFNHWNIFGSLYSIECLCIKCFGVLFSYILFMVSITCIFCILQYIRTRINLYIYVLTNCSNKNIGYEGEIVWIKPIHNLEDSFSNKHWLSN